MPLPGVPITDVPNEGDAAYPTLTAIKSTDSVGPTAANRQPNQLRTRDLTLRDRVNKLITAMTYIAQGAAGSTDYYLRRDGTLPMLADLDMNANRIDDIKRIVMTAAGSGGEGIFAGDNLIQDVLDPVGLQDAATKNYVDSQVGGANSDSLNLRKIWRALSVDATGGGVQSATSAFVITTGNTGGPVRPPEKIRAKMVIFSDDTYTTPAEVWEFETVSFISAGNISWQTTFDPPIGGTYPANWRFGASGSGVELPNTKWSAVNDSKVTNEYGRYVFQSTGTPLGTLLITDVFYLEDSFGSSEEVSVRFGWDEANDEFEVELRSDVRNIMLTMELIWHLPYVY